MKTDETEPEGETPGEDIPVEKEPEVDKPEEEGPVGAEPEEVEPVEEGPVGAEPEEEEPEEERPVEKEPEQMGPLGREPDKEEKDDDWTDEDEEVFISYGDQASKSVAKKTKKPVRRRLFQILDPATETEKKMEAVDAQTEENVIQTHPESSTSAVNNQETIRK